MGCSLFYDSLQLFLGVRRALLGHELIDLIGYQRPNTNHYLSHHFSVFLSDLVGNFTLMGVRVPIRLIPSA